MNNTVPSVVAAMRIVERLAAEPGGLSRSALAAEPGLSSSTCYRILRSLEAVGWAAKGADGRWRLGPGLAAVAAAARDRTLALDAARATLGRLAAGHGISCKLSMRRGLEQVVAVRAEPPGEMLASGVEGVRYPVAEGSSGAALLSDMEPDEALALLKTARKPQTSAGFLRAALADVREKGWCGRRRIADWPISALSAPVRDASGEIAAALTFIVPDSRFSDPALPPLLLEAARECGGAGQQHGARRSRPRDKRQ